MNKTENIIQNFKLVEITYKISTEGQVFEQTDAPVNYIHGKDTGMHEKIIEALLGQREGATVDVPLLPAEAFGEVNPNLIFEDEITNVPKEYQQLGKVVAFNNEKGEKHHFTVKHIEGNKVLFDGNHPMAGKTLLFSVTILQVRDATADELTGATPTGLDAGKQVRH